MFSVSVSELAKHEILLVAKPNYIFSMVHYLGTKPSRLSHLTRHSYGTLRRQTGGFYNWKWPEVCRDSRSNLLTSSPGSPSLPGRPSCPCVPWDSKERSWVAWNSSFCLTLKNWTSTKFDRKILLLSTICHLFTIMLAALSPFVYWWPLKDPIPVTLLLMQLHQRGHL